MNENESRLTGGEWEVYKCLWEEAPLTLTQIANRLIKRVGWSRSTGETVVRRMEKKGLFRVERGERAKLYFPAIPRREAEARETRAFLSRVYDGSLGLMLSAMTEGESLTPAELCELHELLRKMEGGGND